jgi:hypothetical protein
MELGQRKENHEKGPEVHQNKHRPLEQFHPPTGEVLSSLQSSSLSIPEQCYPFFAWQFIRLLASSVYSLKKIHICSNLVP